MTSVLLQVRSALRKVADPSKAPGMRAYMKSEMPYRRVPVPLMRRVCREVFRKREFRSRGAWRREVLELWTGARYREERYAAIELTDDPRARPYQTPGLLPLYERIIVEGAWWDYVDAVAVHRLGPILEAAPGPVRKILGEWSRGMNLWKRRSAILSQITLKERTDLGFLYRCIEPSLGSGEFFLQKAIGWALREHAWTDPREIVGYVRKHRDQLPRLAKREALKNVLRSGGLSRIP
jgi:3-methyladenine DNA glycosylase AlkD